MSKRGWWCWLSANGRLYGYPDKKEWERAAPTAGVEVIYVEEAEPPKPLELWSVVNRNGDVYMSRTSRDDAEVSLKWVKDNGLHSPYRIVHTVEPTTPAWPEDAPAWANWWARDEDGERWYYQTCPAMGKESWIGRGNNCVIRAPDAIDLAPGKRWMESLVGKP